MVEFEVSGVLYRAGKLNVFDQGHLARRIAPLVPKSVPAIKAFAELKRQADASEGTMGLSDILDSLDSVSPLADALAGLTDDAFKQIMVLCLSVVQRQQGNNWAAVAKGDAIMFSDIEFGQIMPMISQVVRLNLGNFISGLLSAPPEASAPPPAAAG